MTKITVIKSMFGVTALCLKKKQKQKRQTVCDLRKNLCSFKKKLESKIH